MNHPLRFHRSLCRLLMGFSAACATIAFAVELPVVAPATRPATQPASTTSEAAPSLLGEVFESRSAGLAFAPPADCTKIIRQASNQIVDYVNPEKHWSLMVSKSSLGQPMELASSPGNPGLIDITIDQLKTAIPGATILRREVINIGSNYCGLVVLRYSIGSQRWLQQQASLQVNNQLYYIFKFITPGGTSRVAEGTEDNSPPDPAEKLAVETFNALLDSTKVLDRSDIKADQVNRLYRTRAQFLNWTPDKFHQVVDPAFKAKNDDALEHKQYFLVYRDHEIIGYSYEWDLIENRDGKDGAVVYIRSHTEPEKGRIIDIGSNMWTAFDRRSEKWVHTTVIHNSDLKLGEAETHGTEVGDMTWETKLEWAPKSGVESDEEAKRDAKTGLHRAGVPLMRPADLHTLEVTLIGKRTTAKPIHKDLPPMYLPQACGHLLPRLLLDPKPFEKRTYMFYAYVGEAGEVVARYVDVDLPRHMVWKQKPVEAVAVSDRIGLDGSATVHYITLDGTYLYSENKETKVIMMPTTEDELRAKWKDVDFTKPQDIPGKPAADISEETPSRGLPPVLR